VKNGRRICGSGAALANAPLAQNKAYFEAKLQSSGEWLASLWLLLVCLSCLPVAMQKLVFVFTANRSNYSFCSS